MNPVELWEASEEAFAAACECRRNGATWWAETLAALSAEFADQACDMERLLGIQRELH